MAYLDKTGLSRLWSKIKSYVSTNFAAKSHTHAVATTSVDGLMAKADKTKLNGIASGAQVNSITGVKGSVESSYRKGNVNITPANIGLGNVNNTADNAKNVASAAKLTTARTIGGASFDGTANINITELYGSTDNRNVKTEPNDYNTKFKVAGLKSASAINFPLSGYSGLIGFRPWSDNSGGNSHELAFAATGELYHRHGATTTWSAWLPIGIFTATPTTNQVLVASNATGGIKTSGYTIAKSVPSNAVFTDTTYGAATESVNGLMSAADKAKLNKINYVFGVDATGPYIEDI